MLIAGVIAPAIKSNVSAIVYLVIDLKNKASFTISSLKQKWNMVQIADLEFFCLSLRVLRDLQTLAFFRDVPVMAIFTVAKFPDFRSGTVSSTLQQSSAL